nr:hypothetical protein [Tanacetum cinerariifolium]
MPPKRTSTFAAPAMNQAAIRQLIDDHVAAALEAQAANMANTDNTNRNPKQASVARKCSYKEFMSCQKELLELSPGLSVRNQCFLVATASKIASRVIDSRVNTNAPLSSSLPSNSFDLQQIAASIEDKLDIRMNHFEKSLNDMKAFVTSPAPIKAVKEVFVTCGSNHSYNHCPLTRGGNEFPIFHDNIQQFQTAAVGNFVQGNDFNSNHNQNRGNNQGVVYQNPPQQVSTYQAPVS